MSLKQAVRNKRTKKGFALVFVILIAAAMMIPILMLISSTIPRRTNVTGEAVSDRTLALADSTVDNILNQINTFPFTFKASSKIDNYDPLDPNSGNYDIASGLSQDFLVYYYISQLNGGVVPEIPYPATTAAVTQFEESCAKISGYVSTYLYNLNTQEYYAVWDTSNNKVAHVTNVGPDGDVKTASLKSLSSGSTSIIATIDSNNYKTDNLWAEIDTNTKYWPGEPDKWDITVTAYLISKPDIKRTVKASASRGTPLSGPEEYADGSWFTHDTSTTTIPGHNFADYSGLYHSKAYFGQFETTTGPIRSDANLYMGGWANDPVFANNRVYDEAVDDTNGNHDGRFGADKKDLAWAKANGYATDGYPAANWANVDDALYGTNPVRNPADPNGGIQDKALPNYYVNGSATIVFSVENGVGKVTINGVKYDMPPSPYGIIFVEGTATVSGKVKGQCSVGASKINIGGSIIYDTPPRLDRNEPIPANPDLLGLISHGDITITTATFNANHHLRIDAAMISKAGNFGIDANAPSHTIDPTGTYEAWWNGCQAAWDTSNAPAVVLGNNKVRGYEIQHTNYDWNLRDYGVPPYYPVTSKTGETTDLIDQWPIVTDFTLINQNNGILTHLTKNQLTPITSSSDPAAYNAGFRYKYVYDGITYYCADGNNFNWYATATMNKTALYRISWKEQIAIPVKPANP